MNWWEMDPIGIDPDDNDSAWGGHPLPPWLYRVAGATVGDYEAIAAATARMFGRTFSWVSQSLWVRMCGPIEYVGRVTMPVELNERVRRAVGTFSRDDAFVLGEEFNVLGRTAPKLSMHRVHTVIPDWVAQVLATEALKIPRARLAVLPNLDSDRPRDVIRSNGPPNVRESA